MKLEECIVYDQVISFEPFEEIADDGESVHHSRRHFGAELEAEGRGM